MGDKKELSRKSLRKDQVIEIHFAPWPEPPPETLRLPGMMKWWADMKLARERDTETFQSLVNNLGHGIIAQTVVDAGGP